jgi:hypothetical protein
MQQNIFMKRRRKGIVTFVRYWIGCRDSHTFMLDVVCIIPYFELDGVEKQFSNSIT